MTARDYVRTVQIRGEDPARAARESQNPNRHLEGNLFSLALPRLLVQSAASPFLRLRFTVKQKKSGNRSVALRS